MKIGERIKAERQAQGIKRTQLAAMTAIPYPTLAGIENGDQDSSTKLHEIAQALRVRPQWLETGRGPKKPAAAGDEDWAPIKANTQGLAAGDGRVPDEYAETHKLMFRASSLRKQGLKPDKLEVHYARGDSMLPRIRDGDAMLIDTSDTRIRDGQIYWIRHEGHDFVKILHKAGKAIVIESMNKAHPEHAKPVLVQPGDEFEVLGRFRWVGSWEQ